MGNTPYLALDIVHKSPKISEVGSKELFKFEPDNGFSCLVLSFILYLPVTNDVLKKKSYKQNLIWPSGLGHVKIIFTLLIEFIID